MAEEHVCPECGAVIESTDDLEKHEVKHMEVEGKSVNPYEDTKHDLYLCKGCKRPFGLKPKDA